MTLHICNVLNNLSAEKKFQRLNFILKKHASAMIVPSLMTVLRDRFGSDPYIILVGCLLSLRTRDSVTLIAADTLLSIASTPTQMIMLDIVEIQRLIKSVGFSSNKAQVIKSISYRLIQDHQGIVPSVYENLIALKGVGLKTAHLVLAEGFGIPAICVDTHVHRLSNAFGLVKTDTPEQTCVALQMIIPIDDWISCNRIFVLWGQRIHTARNKNCAWCVLLTYE